MGRPTIKPLSALISAIEPIEVVGSTDVAVNAITCDSRSVSDGDLFVAIRGAVADGHSYVPLAARSGAVAVVVEEKVADIEGTPQIVVSDASAALGPLAAALLDSPSDTMKMIGVTGTNGKTTTTYILSSILQAAGIACGNIGTVSARWPGGEVASKLTTPDAASLQALLARMRDEGTEAVAMEVSSHAIEMHRHRGCAFDAIIFTNLTQDHLDFHADMESYYSAKRALLTDSSVHKHGVVATINLDDPWGVRLAREVTIMVRGFCLEGGEADAQGGSHGSSAWLVARGVEVGAKGTRMRLVGEESGIDIMVSMPLLGRLNVYNAVAAACCALSLGVEPAAVARGLSEVSAPPGRLESVENTADITVLVDYAHTPDGLRATLSACRELTQGRVVCVFGCGGDRDATKRPLMGAEVARGADVAYVTSDNPRTESPDTIIEAILSGMGDSAPIVQPDRRSAIFSAVAAAEAGDIVLIAGKGHETGQIIGSEVLPFSDVEVAREALSALDGSTVEVTDNTTDAVTDEATDGATDEV